MPAHRKPNRRHALEGTLRRDRHARVPAGARLRKVPAVPRDLSDRAKPHWRGLARVLVGLGTIRAADLPALALLTETLATVDHARETIESEGMTVTSRGAVKGHPAIAAMQAARAQAVALMAHFGLTPTSRERVETVGSFQGGKFAGLLGGVDENPAAERYFDDDGNLDAYLADNPSRRQ